MRRRGASGQADVALGPGLGAAALLVALTSATWFHVANVRIDYGGTLDRAARMAAGEQLYRDVQSPYGPLADYALASAFRVFGIRLDTARALAALLLAAQSALLWRIAARLAPPVERALGLVLFWLFYGFSPGVVQWFPPNTYSAPFGVVFATLTLALLLADLERPSGRRLAAASLAAALAGLSKVEFGLVAVALIVARLVALPADGRGLVRRAVPALVPGAVVTLATVALLVARVPWRILAFDNLVRFRSFGRPFGALLVTQTQTLPSTFGMAIVQYGLVFPCWCVAIDRCLDRGRSRPWRRWLARALAATLVTWPLTPWFWVTSDFDPVTYVTVSQFRWSAIASIVMAAVAVWRDPARERPATWAFLLIAVFSVVATVRWRFLIAWPAFYAPFAPLLAIALVRTVASRLGVHRIAVVPLVMTLALVPAVRFLAEWHGRCTFPLEYPRGRILAPADEGGQMAAVVNWLRRNTVPADFVSVLPEERLINFLAERRNPTPDSGIGPGWLAEPADEDVFLARLDAAQPRAVILSSRVYPEFATGSIDQYEPRVVQWVRGHCRPALRTGFYVVHDCGPRVGLPDPMSGPRS
jgi:dolichyl-phosphate-mannose-protein mannosyltransferase